MSICMPKSKVALACALLLASIAWAFAVSGTAYADDVVQPDGKDGAAQVTEGLDQGDSQPADEAPGPVADEAVVAGGEGASLPETPDSEGDTGSGTQQVPATAQDGAVGQDPDDVTLDSESTEGNDVENVPLVAAEEQEEEEVLQTTPTASVEFRVHVQNIGDQKTKKAGVGKSNKGFAGTSGKSLRLEALWMKLDSSLSGHIEYQVHVQNVGWQTVRRDGKMAGTSGKAYRLEGIRIALTGEVSKYFDIIYRVHVQNIGWQGWKKNGQFAGTSGESLRLEGLEVYLQEKEKPSSKEAAGIVNLVYRAHVQNVGNQPLKTDKETAGTTGRALRVEQLKIWLNKGGYNGGIQFRGMVQGSKSWTGWKTSGKAIGTTGSSKRLESFQVKLTGDIAAVYDIEYRAHVQNIGWQPWAVNGGTSGTTGKGLRIEAVQLKLVKKGASAKVSNGTYVITLASNANTEFAASGTKVKKAAFSTTKTAGKFYVRNENGGVTLQSALTGKFLADTGSVVLQSWKSTSKNQVWTLSRDGGLRLMNKATGKAILISSGEAATSATGKGVMMTRVNLVNNGTYIMTNAAKGMVLDVSGASWNSGANIMVGKANGGGNQVFTFENKGKDWCKVTNTMTKLGVDLAGGSAANGTNVRQWTANNAKAQQWGARLARDGKLYFVNRSGGTALSATGDGSNGKNVVGKAYNEAATQKWTLKAGSWSFTGSAELDEYVMRIVNQNGKDLRRCFNWMGTLGHVNDASGETFRGIVSDADMTRMALIAKRRGVADCYVDASLFGWLARACGYEAYFRAGGCPSARGGIVPHGWNEIKIGGTTYVCDANLRRDLPSYNWYMISYSGSPVTYSIW